MRRTDQRLQNKHTSILEVAKGGHHETSDAEERNRPVARVLPEEADWDDLMRLIYVRKKLDAGLRDSEAGRVFTTEQIRKSLRIC